ncbi:YeiH family protein [Microbulbifer sp. S227A]|uniref:YeiH family protein n=1 Tax=Microbulbifer sp. S227A TaxID=3415131 RepID=UPI003C7E7CD1
MHFPTLVKSLIPGVLLSGLIAISSQFLSDHYGAPAMLMALLIGIALNFLSEDNRCGIGITFASKKILRFGVALLGVRISFEMASDLGWTIVLLVIGGVLATIAFGMLIAKSFGHGPRFAFLSAGSVAICGASAAMAISAILPRDDRTEERLVFTVVGVTLLSTVAMIAYPILAELLGFDARLTGVFIGASIHDVAQVVGAGFSVSDEVGEIATVVKLLRVSTLAPVILVAAIVIRRWAGGADASDRPAIIPGFVASFVLLVTLNSFGVIPQPVIALAVELSRWCLLTAVAAVGLRTNLRDVVDVGGAAMALLVLETAFLGCLTAGLLMLLS